MLIISMIAFIIPSFALSPAMLHAQDDLADTDEASSSEAELADAADGRVAVIRGYHGYNAPIFGQALAAQGIASVPIDGWLPTEQYRQYAAVIIDGRLAQGRISPSRYTQQDREHVLQYIDEGGHLIILFNGIEVFDDAPGHEILTAITGQSPAVTNPRGVSTIVAHPWVKHLPGDEYPAWAQGQGKPINFTQGHGLLLTDPGRAILYERKLGEGRFIYVGWDIFRNEPSGRAKADAQHEAAYQQQTMILYHIAQDLFPQRVIDRHPRAIFDHPYELPANMPPPEATQAQSAIAGKALTHPPIRPLPVASTRPMSQASQGSVFFVDPNHGDDAHQGSIDRPWRTLAHATAKLQPGQTLYLRQGIYHEKVTLKLEGTKDNPITVRSYPGELAVLDGGIPVFLNNPSAAWRPCADGVQGEYESTATYPDLATSRVSVSGMFADSYIPLMGYQFRADLQSDNPWWNLKQNHTDDIPIYSGPGVWYNRDTQRIHIRLAHTKLPHLGDENYTGPTDPREIPLVISHRNEGGTLTLRNASHVIVQDLVIRGSLASPLQVVSSSDITLDGLSIHGGASAVSVSHTQGLRMIHSVIRGQSAPWIYRSSLKYRSIESRLFSTGSWQPLGNSDFELAYNEFTDSVDGVFLGNVSFVRFHHNLLDNCSDDGLFLSGTADHQGNMHSGPVLIYQNVFSRCLQAFAFGVGHGRQPATEDGGVLTGRGLWVYRNLFDLRGPVNYFQPRAADAVVTPAYSRSQVDHGSPVWEPMLFYHNTIVMHGPAFRSGYLSGWGGFMNTPARVLLNNILVQLEKPAGAVFRPGSQKLLFDANLHWSVSEGDAGKDQFHSRARESLGHILRRITDSTRGAHPVLYFDPPEGDAIADLLPDAAQRATPLVLRGEHDIYADPMLTTLPADWRTPLNIQLQPGSAAIDAGAAIPSRWPDAYASSAADAGKPDLGALPLGQPGWRYGAWGRLSVTPDAPGARN